ncbi:hypothetical protein SAMN05444168_4096 [Paraburkholderia phenazinium]|uniref:Uncharacterized protein n=1 Tax=Paraburkholderia phenazinium TaxID=60549 RepID=A0A1N6J9T0_9BURK|nr:hypothetical protein SAMN05444168_4096 [Paraburkholderia phenazinium]
MHWRRREVSNFDAAVVSGNCGKTSGHADATRHRCTLRLTICNAAEDQASVIGLEKKHCFAQYSRSY